MMLQHWLTNSQQHIFLLFAESLWQLLDLTFFFLLYSFSFSSSRTSLKFISPQTKTLETQTQLSKPLNELPLFSLFTTVFTIANHFIFEWSLFWRIFVQMLLDFCKLKRNCSDMASHSMIHYIYYSVHTQGSLPLDL